jgi:lipoprotein-releasing system ATP-binding protein
VFSLFTDLRESLSTTCLVVTHNEKLAEQADRIVELRDGKIA